jgi:DNA-binding CsgD family transcriptional regulator
VTGVIVGRDAELASLRDFVASVSDGAAALVLQGDAGVGKTTLWTEGVAHAEVQGLRVLQARPAESETTFSFSGLGDLLQPVVDEALAALPDPQRRALALALVLEDAEGPPPDGRAVGVAALNALRALAAESALLVAVDDAQWLDSASAAALAYGARRLSGEPVGLLLARRAPVESALVLELRRSFPSDRFGDVYVGPLEMGALHRVIHEHLGVALPRPLLAEVHEASGGNPFYALEIVRMLRRSGVSVEAGQPLPLPESLRALVHERLLALPAQSREYLLAASALSRPTVALVEAACGVEREAGLGPALEARVVELEGDRIRFTHPLLAAGAYEAADPLRRAQVHSCLAELVEDPEARGRHLAASVTEPNETVAAALEEAAAAARARGAPRTAALLLDRARELTPPDREDEALRRAVEAAYLHYESGDSPRAEAQLRDVIATLAPGRRRARAVMRLARVRSYEAQAEAAELFLQAIEEAEGDWEILAVAHEGVATCLFRLTKRLDESVEHAVLAAGYARDLDDQALEAEALGTQWIAETLLGRESASTTAERALALQPAVDDRRILSQPLFTLAGHSMWTDDLERARDLFLELLDRSRDRGDESSPPTVLSHLAQVECQLGDLESARRHALEGQEASEQSGQHTLFAHNLALEGLVEAELGRAEHARRTTLRALELVPATGSSHAELLATRALGQLELALGDAEAAAARLGPAVAFIRQEAIGEPGVVPFVVDQVEALVELGRRDEAVELLDWHEGNARRLERASAVAACLRCRGMLAAQSGELDAALADYEEALEWHAKGTLPLERARTLLALGAAQRRAKRRREARETLEEALGVFEGMGAALWAERASAELRRISGRAASPGALTPAEERVAALVAEGKTNREVASALFLSERTVEGHLSRVFAKLGVRSRTELAHVQASGAIKGVAAPNTGDSPVSPTTAAP